MEINHLLSAEGSLNKCPFSIGKLPQGMVLCNKKQQGYSKREREARAPDSREGTGDREETRSWREGRQEAWEQKGGERRDSPAAMPASPAPLGPAGQV